MEKRSVRFLTALLLAFTLSLSLTLLQQSWYYDSIEDSARRENKFVANAVRNLYFACAAGPEHDDKFLEQLPFLSRSAPPHVSVRRDNELLHDNQHPVDSSRSVIDTSIVIRDSSTRAALTIHVAQGVRPHPGTSLVRSLTWSGGSGLKSLLRSVEGGSGVPADKNYRRSQFLWATWLVLGIVAYLGLTLWNRDRRLWQRLRERAVAPIQDALKDSEEKLGKANDEVSHLTSKKSTLEKELNDATASKTGLVKDLSESEKGKAKLKEELETVTAMLDMAIAEKRSAEEESEEHKQKLNEIYSSQRTTAQERTVINAAGNQDSRTRELERFLKSQLSKDGEKSESVGFAGHSSSSELSNYYKGSNRLQSFVASFCAAPAGDAEESRRQPTALIEVEPWVVQGGQIANADAGNLLVHFKGVRRVRDGACLRLPYRVKRPRDISRLGFVLAVWLKANCPDFREFEIRVRETSSN